MRKDEFPIVHEYCRQKTIRELEKIKAEINQIDMHQFNRTKVLNILDNRISELKENKQ